MCLHLLSWRCNSWITLLLAIFWASVTGVFNRKSWPKALSRIPNTWVTQSALDWESLSPTAGVLILFRVATAWSATSRALLLLWLVELLVARLKVLMSKSGGHVNHSEMEWPSGSSIIFWIQSCKSRLKIWLNGVIMPLAVSIATSLSYLLIVSSVSLEMGVMDLLVRNTVWSFLGTLGKSALEADCCCKANRAAVGVWLLESGAGGGIVAATPPGSTSVAGRPPPKPAVLIVATRANTESGTPKASK